MKIVYLKAGIYPQTNCMNCFNNQQQIKRTKNETGKEKQDDNFINILINSSYLKTF